MGEKRQKMVHFWTNEDICAILTQLDEQMLPFQKYQFSELKEGLKLLGKGSSAYVYEAQKRGKKKKDYVIKVIGFGNQRADTGCFQNAVSLQKRMGSLFHVVEIYDTAELCIRLEGEHEVTSICEEKAWSNAPDEQRMTNRSEVHDVVKSETLSSNGEEKPAGNYLHLQFIVMEKVSPVFCMDGYHPKLFQPRLALCHESEILKLAYEIGMAIDKAHKENLLHRDIKLENIFYSVKEKHYKLGDFGIAKSMENGLVSTRAFTKGYGAPEVIGTTEDKYDRTADIYSFGMTLYVLLNELRFPGSKNYQPNIASQYQSGFVPLEPVHGSDELCRIVLKMISYDPDDRYQSMDEVLNALDGLLHGNRLKYQREHKELYFVMASAFSMIGTVLWKLSFAPDLSFHFSFWMGLFALLCIVKGFIKFQMKDAVFSSIGILGTGIYLIMATGFTWWKVLILLLLSLFLDETAGIVGLGLLLADVTCLYMEHAGLSVLSFSGFRWIAVLLLSLAAVLLLLYLILKIRKIEITRQYFSKNIAWMIFAGYYLMLVYFGYSAERSIKPAIQVLEWIFGKSGVEFFLSWNPTLVGICGSCFCFFWMIREYVLQSLDKRE